MTRGVVIFAFNSEKTDYYKMAEFTAKRISHFLNLPVTLITDENTLPIDHFEFDHVILTVPDRSNFKQRDMWINKGRYLAYDLSPYDKTILLDVDYLINSNQLLRLFELDTDFACHRDITMIAELDFKDEYLNKFSYRTLWATVVYFEKTKRAKHIFESMKMVQENYLHYARLHHFVDGSFRNDFALTLALRIANGHLDVPSDFIPWKLAHVGRGVIVVPESKDELNHKFYLFRDSARRNKIRKEWMTVEGYDFHMLDKNNFKEILSE